MTSGTLVVDRPRAGIVVATLNRPDRLNALTFSMFGELEQLAAAIGADDGARVLVLSGAGRGFCAGLDLDDAATLPDMTAARFLHDQEGWSRAITSFRRLPKPVIAAVNGPAAGAGFSLALAADIRLASPAARFNAAFIKIGLTGGDCGSSWMLPRIVGLGHAYEILLTGRLIDADEAARIGLVNRVVPAPDLLTAALDLGFERRVAGETNGGERCSSGRSEMYQWSLPSAPARGKTQRSSGTPAARAAPAEQTMPAPWSTCMLAVHNFG